MYSTLVSHLLYCRVHYYLGSFRILILPRRRVTDTRLTDSKNKQYCHYHLTGRNTEAINSWKSSFMPTQQNNEIKIQNIVCHTILPTFGICACILVIGTCIFVYMFLPIPPTLNMLSRKMIITTIMNWAKG